MVSWTVRWITQSHTRRLPAIGLQAARCESAVFATQGVVVGVKRVPFVYGPSVFVCSTTTLMPTQ